MAEKLTQRIEVPVWMISLFVPLMLSILVALVSVVNAQANNNGTVTTSITEINKRLDRIETKVESNNTNILKLFNNEK